MSVTSPVPTTVRAPGAARRAGYVLAAAINAALLYAANHVLEWDVLPFLTPAFDDVLPLLSVSLWIGIGVNVLYVFDDRVFVKSPTQIISLAVNLAVTIQMWQVYPFDFSSYQFPWNGLVRTVLIVGIVGTAIGIVVELTRLIRAAGATDR